MERLKDIIKKIKDSEQSGKILRNEYVVDNINKALDVVEQIGKAKNKKFVIDDDNRWVYTQLIKWVQGDRSFECIDIETRQRKPGNLSAGIYLAGPTGTGKSWALEIMSLLSQIDDVRLFCAGKMTKLEFPSVRTNQVCNEFAQGQSIEKYNQMPIVCFQDLCSLSEPEESMYMGNRLKIMQSIIESRGDRQDLITLFSSNVKFDSPHFRDRYTDRVVSRMFEMCNYLELKGGDRRRI
ncbi:P-loop NTPase family protein [Carboxylicivirga marina]|uniref:ATPase AAA-type core domain-containing protein n=1 Tax=Carboxylicivirga marina TaxID=2800988 RepID=A0ABS1HGB7_9BACT|nr:hypothetical protein [Carboxylicivirga marina]MBK3516689.1 hypothetical protein [Carboxylicivirga marina]